MVGVLDMKTEWRTLQLSLPACHPAPYLVGHVTWAVIRRIVVGAAVGAAAVGMRYGNAEETEEQL